MLTTRDYTHWCPNPHCRRALVIVLEDRGWNCFGCGAEGKDVHTLKPIAGTTAAAPSGALASRATPTGPSQYTHPPLFQTLLLTLLAIAVIVGGLYACDTRRGEAEHVIGAHQPATSNMIPGGGDRLELRGVEVAVASVV
jgi:hypothetical protein